MKKLDMDLSKARITVSIAFGVTEDLHYNNSVCYQRFCCKIEFAVIKKLHMDPSKARILDTFEQFFFMNHTFVYLFESYRRGDSDRCLKRVFS